MGTTKPLNSVRAIIKKLQTSGAVANLPQKDRSEEFGEGQTHRITVQELHKKPRTGVTKSQNEP